MCGGLRAGRQEGGGERRRERGVCTGDRAATADGGGGARGAQRTSNMPYMLVTLDVSQPSGWLKAVAPCRGSQAGHTVRGGLRAGERARDCRLGARARREARTSNIWPMSVTRVVSQGQLSGWLKAVARCEPRVASTGHTVRGGLQAGRREAAGERGVCRQRAGERAATADCGAVRGEQRTQNIWRMSVTREVSQPSGWLKACAPCRGSQAGHTVRGGLRAGGRERMVWRAIAVCTQRAGKRAATADFGGQGAGSSAR